jgi:hypothetical protein
MNKYRRMTVCSRHGGDENIKTLVSRLEGKKLLDTHICGKEDDNIKIVLEVMAYKCVDWIS